MCMFNSKIGFIGCGNIANAIIGGAVGVGYIKYENLYLFDTDSDKIAPFLEKGAAVCGSAKELVSLCDFVFLTVKPQIYEAVLSSIADSASGTCFISVAAGITVDYVKKLLGFDAPVIRVMPNTPLLCGKGASALVKRAPVTEERFEFIKGLFACSGECVSVDEKLINTVTAISGSAPAYVLRFAKALIDFGVQNGLSAEDAEKLVLATVSGSGELAINSDCSIDTLIKNVTSPNGTTYAGLCSMDKTGFDASLTAALEATLQRAEELTK